MAASPPGSRTATGGERERRPRATEAALPALTLEGADVLRDAPELVRGHVGVAQRVEQRGLAVVHVAHDAHHGRARPQRRSGGRRRWHRVLVLNRTVLVMNARVLCGQTTAVCGGFSGSILMVVFSYNRVV